MNKDVSNLEKIQIKTKQVDDSIEQSIYHSIMQVEFKQKVENAGIDLSGLLKEKKKNATMFYKFNYLLKDFHLNGEIDICDSLTFLEDDFCYKEIFKCLNAENILLVKSLMAKKYNIKKKR
jgi:hypothetical protein